MTQILERTGTVLAERYVLERELGRGGMAAVYLGRDLKHSRQVAVKVLRPELAAALGPDRFLREIEFASRLTHPHILPLHDSGDADGLLFYVMPYVDGETLRERLRREGSLPVEEVRRIAGEVADALDYAHAQGIVHRDVKPGNILLEDGHAVVADFGIAKAITSAGGDDSSSTGLAIGTPAYMSPEQIVAAGPIDGRADLYSLGCVVYEMLTGRPPFTAATSQALAARHLHEPPPPLRSVLPDLPEDVEQAVNIALEKVPERRFATAGEFAESLTGRRPGSRRRAWWRWPAVLGGVGLVGTATALGLAWREPAPPLDPGRILVFPISSRSAGTSSATTEDVALAIVASLNSTGSLSALRASRGVGPSRRSASREGAGFYLDASLVASDSLRLVLDLHDVGTGRTTQRTVAVASTAGAWSLGVRAALELVSLLIPTGETSGLPSLTGRSPAAVAEYFRGERSYRRAAFNEALTHFRRAVSADSGFAIAAIRGAQAATWSNQQLEAEALLDVALREVDRLPARQRELAWGMEAWLAGGADTALARFRRAAALDPVAAEPWMYLGETYNHLLPRASPLDSLAEDAYLQARARDSTFAPLLFHLIEFAVRRGDLIRSRALLDEYRRARPDATLLTVAELGLLCLSGPEAGGGVWAVSERTVYPLFLAAQTFSLGGLRRPECARVALEAVLSAEHSYRFGALLMLHGLLIAQGREEELRAVLSRDTVFSSSIRGQLAVLAALAGADFAAEADSFVAGELRKHRSAPDALSSLEAWFVGTWLAHQGNGQEALELSDMVRRRAAGTDARRDSLLAASLMAHGTLASGDSASALDQLRSLMPTAASHAALTWDPWESLGGERLLLARLLLARGRPLEAYEVATGFDSPVPVPYLMFLPASLELRVAAARRLGDHRLAERSATRLQALRAAGPARDPSLVEKAR